MFEKPNSTSVKDLLINDIAKVGNHPREIIEKVISFQGEDILRAVKLHTQVEISGLGVLFVSKGKLDKRIEKYTRFVEKESTKPEIQEVNKKILEYLKEKKCQLLKNT